MVAGEAKEEIGESDVDEEWWGWTTATLRHAWWQRPRPQQLSDDNDDDDDDEEADADGSMAE